MSSNRPEWGDELTKEVRELRTDVRSVEKDLRADLKVIGDRVNDYVKSVGDVQGSNRTFTGIISVIAAVVIAAIVGGGFWVNKEQSRVVEKIGEHTGKLDSLSSKVDEASKKAGEAATTASSAVTPIAKQVTELHEAVATSKQQVESLGAVAQSLTTELKEVQKRVGEIESIKNAVKSLDEVSSKATSAISDLSQVVMRLPRGGKEISLWFQLTGKNQTRPADEAKRPDAVFFFFDVRVEDDETITVDNTADVRALLSPPQSEKFALMLNESIACTGKVVRDNTLRVRLSVPVQSADQVTKYLAASGSFSGQAFIYLAAVTWKHYLTDWIEQVPT